MIGWSAGRMRAKRGFCRRLQNITLPEARCQVDRGINAHLPFVHTPIFVKNHFFHQNMDNIQKDISKSHVMSIFLTVRAYSSYQLLIGQKRAIFVLATLSCPKKENTDIASKAWPCRCFSDVFTYVKMSVGDKCIKVEYSPQLRIPSPFI